MEKTKQSFAGSFSKIVTIILLVATIATLFMPWIYIGIKGKNRNYDLTTIMREEYGSSISLSDILEETAMYVDDSGWARFALWNGKRVAKHLEDSKLSFAEIGVTLAELAGLSLAAEDAFELIGDSGGIIFLLVFSAIVCLILLAVLLIELISNIKHLILEDREPTRIVFPAYVISAGLIILLTVFINAKAKDGTEDLAMFFGISSRNILHLRIALFLGLIFTAILHFGSDRLQDLKSVVPSGKLDIPPIPVGGVFSGVNSKAGWKCKCGKWNIITAAYCSKCGEKRVSNNVCANCGTIRLPGNKYCPQCGQEYPQEEKPTPTIKKKMTCPKCGIAIREGASFCGNCGERIVIETHPDPPASEVPVENRGSATELYENTEAVDTGYIGRHDGSENKKLSRIKYNFKE